MPAITSGISHVGLAVSDLEGSYRFFQAIGYTKMGESRDYPAYFLSSEGGGGGNSILTLWQVSSDGANPFDRKNNVGLHHLALKVLTEEALDEAYRVALKVEGTKSEFPPPGAVQVREARHGVRPVRHPNRARLSPQGVGRGRAQNSVRLLSIKIRDTCYLS
jgi:catechol 2,3-dioxygenase-like lactoylglutathione lyase family enzyme